MIIRVTPFSFGLAAFIYEQKLIKVAPSTGIFIFKYFRFILKSLIFRFKKDFFCCISLVLNIESLLNHFAKYVCLLNIDTLTPDYFPVKTF